jgi:hypothetical protein
MNIENIPTSKIKPYERNTKKHSAKQVEQIAASIEQFGFRQPLVVDRDNVLIIGHGRLQAAKRLGLSEVPCVRADDLTDEQARALRIIDNKTNESEWDLDLLNLELGDFADVDLADFGLELTDPELEHEQNAERTQRRVESILGLEHGEFTGTGKYDMPIMKPVKRLPKIKEWIPFNYVLSDKEPEGKAVHFFIDDYQFERVWNDPERYVDKLSQYVCVATPDFSPYADMPLITQMWNHYRKQWCGAFWQSKGITVIPTVRASKDERSLDWYLDGIPRGGIVMISSMWTAAEGDREYFKREYNTMYEALNPCKVFMYGNVVDGLPGKIERVDTFTKMRWGK